LEAGWLAGRHADDRVEVAPGELVDRALAKIMIDVYDASSTHG